MCIKKHNNYFSDFDNISSIQHYEFMIMSIYHCGQLRSAYYPNKSYVFEYKRDKGAFAIIDLSKRRNISYKESAKILCKHAHYHKRLSRKYFDIEEGDIMLGYLKLTNNSYYEQ